MLGLYFSTLTKVLRTLWKTLHSYKFPREASCSWVLAHWLESEVKSSHQMLVKSFGRINDLFSLIDVQCMCKQRLLLSRILVVQVSWTALQSQFMEQYFSISQFTDTKNGRSRRHKNKLPPPPSSPPYTNPLHQPISNWNAAETTWFISSSLCIFNHSLRFFKVKEENLEDAWMEKRKGGDCRRDLGF